MLRVYRRAFPTSLCTLRSLHQEQQFAATRCHASTAKPVARPKDLPPKFAPLKPLVKQAPSPPVPPSFPPQKAIVTKDPGHRGAFGSSTKTPQVPTPPASTAKDSTSSTRDKTGPSLAPSNPPSPSLQSNASEAKDIIHEPQLLSRPIGLPNPPQAGKNDGLDHRLWRQRRDDFLNYDKHLERRKQL